MFVCSGMLHMLLRSRNAEKAFLRFALGVDEIEVSEFSQPS